MLLGSIQDRLNHLDTEQSDYLQFALALLAELDDSMLINENVLFASISRLIADIDEKLSLQVSEILHHPDFEALESAWLGVDTLVKLPVSTQKVKVRILDMSWDGVSQDVNNSISLRRTILYNLIGNKELNTSGGQPFGIVVVDHAISMDIDQDYDDVYTLELLGRLGDMCLCPFIFSLAGDFFGEKGADWLSDINRVEKILDGPEFATWRHLRTLPEARFIGLVLPKIKLRDIYTTESCHRFIFDETYRKDRGLWGSAAFLLASVAMREFNRINWFGFMKSRWQDQYSGALVNVPPNGAGTFSTKTPTPDVRIITEVGTFYSAQGFVPLCHSLMTDKYFFRGNSSIWKPRKDKTEAVMGQLQTTLMICRIAHYLKVQIRGMIGNFQTADECELYLNNWLDRYSSNLFSADESTLAKYPLSKGLVRVKEIPGQQGRYSCDVLVQPQYQFDNVCGEVILSTDLGAESSSSRGTLA